MPHPIIQAEVDEFEKKFGKYESNEEKQFMVAALHRAVEKAKEEECERIINILHSIPRESVQMDIFWRNAISGIIDDTAPSPSQN